MKNLHKVTFILLVIGGLNWGLVVLGVGVGNFLPQMISNLIYILVFLSTIYEIFTHKANCNCCSMNGMPKDGMQKPSGNM